MLLPIPAISSIPRLDNTVEVPRSTQQIPTWEVLTVSCIVGSFCTSLPVEGLRNVSQWRCFCQFQLKIPFGAFSRTPLAMTPAGRRDCG